MIRETRKPRSKNYSEKSRYFPYICRSRRRFKFNFVWYHACASIPSILRIMAKYSVRRELPTATAQASQTLKPKRINEFCQGCIILYLRFPYQLRKAILDPSCPTLRLLRKHVSCGTVVHYALKLLKLLKSKTLTMIQKKGSDIASMHSLKLYSSRSRILSGPSCALGELQENGHPKCWVPLVL